MRPQLIQKSLITKSEVMITDEQYSSDESKELPHKNEDTEVENIQIKGKLILHHSLLISD